MEGVQTWDRHSPARQGDKRKGFTEQDYAWFLDAAHHQLGRPVVLVWDGLNTHVSRAMRELAAVRVWLTVFQLPTYLRRYLAKQDIDQLRPW